MVKEKGWLIELKPSVVSVPTWFGDDDSGVLGWTIDNLKAIRFARKKDAETVIRLEGFTEAFASEHMWCDYSHKWETRRKWIVCSECGVVQRSDGKNGPCRGPARLRPMERPAE